jgi:uncharacterized repeat protein (TIGR03806 family)
LEIEGSFFLTSFAEDHRGELYAVRYDFEGDEVGIYQIIENDNAGDTDFPTKLSHTGCVNWEDPTQPAASMVAYEPSATLWSDGAEKDRFFAIPNDGRLGVSETDGTLVFPIGSVLMKHFRFGDRLHETRLMMRTEKGWAGYSYEWNDEQTDAVLLDSARTVTLPESGVRWVYPSRSACLECHTQVAGRVLGLEIGLLSKELLGALVENEYFPDEVDAVSDLGTFAALPSAGDDTASVDDRARAYLHVNCASCHQPGGPGRGDIDLRFGVPLKDMGMCGEEPRVGKLWSIGVWDDQLLLAPKRPEDSTVYLRMAVRDVFRMPPLGTDLIDEVGIELMRAWIEGIESCPE